MSVEHLWKNKNWSNSIVYSGLLKYSVSITVSTWNARTCTLDRKLVCVHPQSQACNLLPGCSCSVTGPPGPSAEVPPDIASLFREAVRQTRRCPACPYQRRAACSFSKSICFGRRGKKEEESVTSPASLFTSAQRVSLADDARRQQETRWERDKVRRREQNNLTGDGSSGWSFTCPVGKVTEREASQKNKIE